MLHHKKSRCNEEPSHCNSSLPCSPPLEKKPTQLQRPSSAKNKQKCPLVSSKCMKKKKSIFRHIIKKFQKNIKNKPSVFKRRRGRKRSLEWVPEKTSAFFFQQWGTGKAELIPGFWSSGLFWGRGHPTLVVPGLWSLSGCLSSLQFSIADCLQWPSAHPLYLLWFPISSCWDASEGQRLWSLFLHILALILLCCLIKRLQL